MQFKLRNNTRISVLVLALVGSAVASTQLLISQKPAIARESVRRCIQDLIDDGISETNAAIACRGQRDNDWGNYRDRDRNLELRARSGPTPEGRWRYSAPGVPYDAMIRAGCQNVSGDDWRCRGKKERKTSNLFVSLRYSLWISEQNRAGRNCRKKQGRLHGVRSKALKSNREDKKPALFLRFGSGRRYFGIVVYFYPAR